MRLFFDCAFYRQVEIRDIRLSPDVSYSGQDLEDKLEMTLQRQLGPIEGSFQNIWTDYRRNHWKADPRGKALLWGISDKVIMDRIRGRSGRDATRLD